MKGLRPLSVVGYYTVLALIALASLGPVAWVVLSSLKTNPQILSNAGSLPDPLSFDGYINAFTQVDLTRALLNTFIYAVGGTMGAMVTGFLAAYPTSRLFFRGRRLAIVAFSVALAIPLVGLIVPEFFIVRYLGLFDSKLGLILFYTGMFFPLSFVIMRAFLVSLPFEMEEAATIDGAGYFTILARIVAPLAFPGLITVAVLVFIFIWNEYFFAQLLTISFENLNVQVTLAEFRSSFQRDTAAQLAGTTVAMSVPIITFLFLQRYVISGLTAGASR
ncbi:MAG: carbohydrate ABC transporter permease [Actinobacteria bacterium]|nr:carbohydrate ABC transporter permease [Actinomycetota bacterium]